MMWVKVTKANAEPEADPVEWVNLEQGVQIYADADGTWMMINDGEGSVVGPYTEKPAELLAK